MPNSLYATRCECFAQRIPCSSICHCKNCSNPYGVSPEKPVAGKRKRRPHAMQIIYQPAKDMQKKKRRNVNCRQSEATLDWSGSLGIKVNSLLLEQLAAIGSSSQGVWGMPLREILNFMLFEMAFWAILGQFLFNMYSKS